MERDKTEIEVALEYVLKRLERSWSHALIGELTAAFEALLKAKNYEQEGHK